MCVSDAFSKYAFRNYTPLLNIVGNRSEYHVGKPITTRWYPKSKEVK